jgi:anaerobic magnesium-protoporphyrin IX monomethyl ester cyclase
MIDERGRYIDAYQGARPKLPALGLAYIASVLLKSGHQVRIIEGMAQFYPLDEIARISASFDVVGITSNSFLALLSHRLAGAIREKNGKITIVMGGPHATVVPGEVLQDKNIDFVVTGEGEYSFLELVEALSGGGSAGNIPGVAYRKEDGTVALSERSYCENLDDIPIPARQLLPMHLYHSSEVRSRRNPALHMLSSRGCLYNCSFCCNKSIHRCRLRMHSPERVVEEMAVLVKDFGAREIHFWDDCFVYDEKRVYEICEQIHKTGLNIPWDCEATVDRVNPKLLKMMRSAGCFGLSYGIETGNEERFNKLNKGWLNKDKIRQAVTWTKKAGLRARGYFMLGFVGETLDEMEETIRFSRELDLDYATFSLLAPLPGTDDYKRAQAEGDFDAYYWRHRLLSEISFPLDPVYVPRGVAKEQLLKMHRKACRSFYLRPHIIIRHLFGLRSVGNLLGSVKAAYIIMRRSGGFKNEN